MKDVAVVDLISAFAFELALELHSYLGGWGWDRVRRERVGEEGEMDGIWRERARVDEQKGCE